MDTIRAISLWANTQWHWVSTDWSWLKALQLCVCVLPWFDRIGLLVVAVALIPPVKRSFKYPPMRIGPIVACVLFRLPLGDRLLKFANQIGGRPDAVPYMDRIIDREINKARGILPFNSILMGINSFGMSAIKNVSDCAMQLQIAELEKSIFYSLAISSILLLELFWVHWGKPERYQTPISEVYATAKIARDRAVVLDSAIILSIVCVACISLIVLAASAQQVSSHPTLPVDSCAEHTSAPLAPPAAAVAPMR